MRHWVVVEHRTNGRVTKYTVQRTKFPSLHGKFTKTDFSAAKILCDRLNIMPVLTSKIIYP